MVKANPHHPGGDPAVGQPMPLFLRGEGDGRADPAGNPERRAGYGGILRSSVHPGSHIFHVL